MLPATGTALRIMLVDDHDVVRFGVRLLMERQPGWVVCAEAKTGEQAVATAIEREPDVAIVDIQLPELGGVEAIRQIKQATPSVEIVVFTAQTDEDVVRAVFDGGARSLILKGDENEELIRAVRSAAEHKPYFTPHVSQIIFARYIHGHAAEEPSHSADGLSFREREVVSLVARGMSNKEVAQRLGISVRTVESHRATVMDKLNLRSLSELIRYAIRQQMVDL